MMFIAERRCREICNSSPVRTHAQLRPEIESSRARVPYMAGCEFPPATVLRPGARQSKSKRFLPVYGAEQPTTQRFTPLSHHGVSLLRLDGAHSRLAMRPRIMCHPMCTETQRSPGIGNQRLSQCNHIGPLKSHQGMPEPETTVT